MAEIDEVSRLEKRLNSGPLSVASVVSAVLDCGNVMTKQPFPDVVKACCKLLARLFFVTDNFVRTRIVAAYRMCSRHLEVGLQTVDDDILFPIVRVLDSNDPVARGLTLQALAQLSCLLASRDDIQFRILERLDSSQSSEALAALLAVERVMMLSDSFTEALVRRSAVLLEGSTGTSTTFKLALIRVLGSCHGASIVVKARGILGAVLDSCPAEAFVKCALHSLTQITLHSFLGAEQHVATLFYWVQTDDRPVVQIAALRGLASLVRKSPIHFQLYVARVMALIASYKGHERVLAAMLAVLAFLGRHWSVSKTAIDTHALVPLLSHSCPLVRRWSLRAMSRAASAFSQSAQQLGAYCITRLREASKAALHADFQRGSEFLRACLSLMRSPTWASRIFEAILEASKACSTLIHCVSVGALSFGHCLEPASLARAATDLPAMIQQSVASADSELFCGCMLSCLRLRGPLMGQEVSVSVNSAMASHMQLPAWRLALSRVAREAMHLQHPALAAPIWLLLSQYVETEEFAKWLLALNEISQGEVELQKGRAPECSLHWRRAYALMAACAGQSITVAQPSDRSAQAVSRNYTFRFQHLYARWRIALVEVSPSRDDALRRLEEEARALAWSFADFDPATKQFFLDVQWSLSKLSGSGGSSVAAPPTPSLHQAPYYSVVSTHYYPVLWQELAGSSAPIALARRQDLLLGFRLAAGSLPRYFFRSKPRVSVDLSFVKPKPLEPWHLAQWDLGHCITVDGVIRSTYPMFRPKTVEMTVSVLRVPEKQSNPMTLTAAQACRLLSYDQHGPEVTQITLVGTQVYQSKVISGESFSVPMMVVFPEAPKSQYVLRVKVVILDNDDNAYDMGLGCVAFSMLWTEASASLVK